MRNSLSKEGWGKGGKEKMGKIRERLGLETGFYKIDECINLYRSTWL